VVGFHRTRAAGAGAPTIVEAVKAGKISRFFVIGGCDGAEKGRNYFTDYARATPDDSFILTLGCGKYRIRDHDYGEHLGLPRLLDMGQCNDAYGAIAVAVALAEAFDCGVNDLPLTLVISWFEQKAVAVLLTLLHLGVKGITLGPNPPAFVSPNVSVERLAEQDDRRRALGTEVAPEHPSVAATGVKGQVEEPGLEAGGASRDTDVAGERQVESRAHGGSVHGRDGRQGEPGHGEEASVDAAEPLARRLLQVGEVGAGGEGRRLSGDDQRARLRRGGQPLELGRDLLGHRQGDRVPPRRIPEREGRDPVLDRRLDQAHGSSRGGS
jgi:hypothetical protein